MGDVFKKIIFISPVPTNYNVWKRDFQIINNVLKGNVYKNITIITNLNWRTATEPYSPNFDSPLPVSNQKTKHGVLLLANCKNLIVVSQAASLLVPFDLNVWKVAEKGR